MKKGLVLAGGGSRGAYQIGVWQALREMDYAIEAVAGTSVGALNAAMIAQNDFDAALELWGKLTTGDILDISAQEADLSTPEGVLQAAKGLVESLGGASAAPLHRLVRQVLDEERIRQSPIDFGIVTVRFPDFKPVVLTKEEMEPGKLTDYVLASAACFPAMKSYHIGGEQYIDGGYYNNLPIEIAVGKGAEDIIAVDLQAIGLIRPARYPKARIRTLRCHWDLGPVLEFDPAVSQRNIRLGYLDTLRLFGRVTGRFYAFVPGQLRAIAARLLPFLAESCSRCTFGLVTHRGLPMEDQGKLRLLQALGLRGRHRYDLPRLLMRCAETGGEALGLDPCALYDADGFIDASLAAYRGNIRHTSGDLTPARADALIISAARMAKMGKPVLCAYLSDCIWNVFEHRTRPHSLWALAVQYPDAFVAGIYLLLCRQLREPRFLT